VELLNDGRLRPGDYAEASISFPIGPQGDVYDSDLAGTWISPMHPQIIRDEPGKCPICGMDLVPTAQYGFTNEPVAQPTALHVPRSAVLMAGGNSVVYVETETGRFELRPVTVGPILRDRIVILEGIEPGEQVATAGNFLIDSQMQLAGKPSLIDPTRAVAKEPEQEGPMQFAEIEVRSVAGDTGKQLEELFASYFEVQQALAADKTPPAGAVEQIHARAESLSTDESLAEPARQLVAEAASRSEHLHHMELADARREFKPLSHAIVTLATHVRGTEAETSFTHFYCPMVPGGGGDWLQPGGQLANPYFGSQMLRCGEKVHELPATGRPATESVPQQVDPAPE
jgi:Cu(I)/Ag(I) efflux system membrane fusion protein